jgi:hypothetical protein
MFTIRHNGKEYTGWRYLRADERGAVFQTIFYLGRNRSDPTGNARFASDDEAMNVVARRLLAELVDRVAVIGHLV